jgi:hypothetical protein
VVRWTKRVADGLGHISAFIEAQIQARDYSQIECRCPACTGQIPDPENEDCFLADAPCQCDGKPYAKVCSGCRSYDEWMAALGWIDDQIRRHPS